jgi:hypothetical protein
VSSPGHQNPRGDTATAKEIAALQKKMRKLKKGSKQLKVAQSTMRKLMEHHEQTPALETFSGAQSPVPVVKVLPPSVFDPVEICH